MWKNKNVSKLTEMRIIKAMVFPGVLFGCETWTKAMEKNIDACKMWIWRRMLRVAWTERRTNDAILQEIGAMRGGIIVTESQKTEDDNFRARDEGERSGERDDVGVRRWEEEGRGGEEKIEEGEAG